MSISGDSGNPRECFFDYLSTGIFNIHQNLNLVNSVEHLVLHSSSKRSLSPHESHLAPPTELPIVMLLGPRILLRSSDIQLN